DGRAVADRVDRLLAAAWNTAGAQAGDRSDDAEFFRRVHIDLIGKIPPVAEVRRFLADRSPDKRQALVERLLQSPTHASFFAVQWRQLRAPDAEGDAGKQAALAALDAWLRRQLATNVPYDQWVRELLTFAPDGGPTEDPVAPSPRLFYAGREDKPEELA